MQQVEECIFYPICRLACSTEVRRLVSNSFQRQPKKKYIKYSATDDDEWRLASLRVNMCVSEGDSIYVCVSSIVIVM